MKKESKAVLPVLRTPRLALRPFRADDAPALFRYASDPRVTRFLRFRTHRSLAETRAAIRLMQAGKRFLAWAITRREGGEVIGSCGFVPPNREHRRGEIDYWLGEQHWGRGYATEAVTALIGYGFRGLRLNRVEAFCMPRNAASGRVLEKAGMKYEGLLRQYERIKGRYVDFRVYGILREEWRAGARQKK